MSAYTRDLSDTICGRLADGESLRGICSAPEMPAPSTVRGWVVDDVDGFAERYARARETQAHAIADELLEIADDGSNDWMVRTGKDGSPGWELNGEHVQRSRLRSDTRKWLLSKMLPKVYGDKLELEHSGKVATVSAEPLTEDEWNQRAADSLAPAGRAPKAPR